MTARRVAINTGILYMRMAITVIISLYATRLILNALGAEDFGLFSVVAGAIAMLTFLNTAMATATQRFMSFAQGEGNFEKQKNIFNVSIILHFFIAIAVVVILEVVGYFLFDGILRIPSDRIGVARLIFQFMIASTFFTIISVPYDAVINAHENMLLVAVIGIIEALCKLFIAVFITSTHFDKLFIFGILMTVLSIVLLVIRQIYCHIKYSEVRISIKKYYSKPLFRAMSGFAGWSFLGTTSSMIANYGQGIVINIFFGTVVNAAQGIANQVSGQLGAFAGTMLRALNPVIARSEGSGNRNLMLRATLMGSKLSFFLLMLVYIPVLIDMPYIFRLWLKNVPDYAIIFCRLLLIRNLIEQLFITLTASISAVGNIGRFQVWSSVLNIFPLLVSFVLFKFHYPPYILYLVFILYSIINSILILYFSKLNCNLSVASFIKDVVLRCLFSFLVVLSFSAIPLLLMHENLTRLIVISTVNVVLFFIIIYTIGFTSDERKNILKVISETITQVRDTKLKSKKIITSTIIAPKVT